MMTALSAPAKEDPLDAMDPVTEVVVPTPSASLEPVETPPEETVSESPVPSPSPSPQSSPAAETTVSVFTWPVKGEILSGFSLEALCYDETMGDFRTHSGVDIAAAEGTRVMAIADGTVEDVYSDPWMGTTVLVSHPGGLESMYCNLTSEPGVAKGDSVTCGQVLGMVGNTTLAEAGMSSHLHLEMRENGTSVDPVNYLPEQ